jgi:putative endonuclease
VLSESASRAHHGAPPDGDHRPAVGRLGEQLAAAHLARLGFAVLARNVRTAAGEIDLIAFDGDTLAFIEVKTRSSRSRSGADAPGDETPLAGLRRAQRARLRRAALAWLSERHDERPRARLLRFDAVGVLVDGRGRLLRLDHLEGAW